MNQDLYKIDFPVFQSSPDLVYLDSAASALVPKQVIEAMNKYYTQYPVNVHRGLYALSSEATNAYEQARGSVARFLHCQKEEVIFTSGATIGLNMVAVELTKNLGLGDAVVLTRYEHHANLLPWQWAAKTRGFEIRFLELTADYLVDEESIKTVITDDVKIVSFGLVSNTLGTIAPAQAIIERAKEVGAKTVVDAAQAVAHMPMNTQKLGCDFLVFSGHKVYGPRGVGVLYGKSQELEKLTPHIYGGGMVHDASYEDASWAEAPYKFEAGTPPIADAIGLGASVEYVMNIGWKAIEMHEKELTAYALEQLVGKVDVIGHATVDGRIGVISFLVPGVHPHDVAEILGRKNVAVRVGHHCTKPLMKHLGIVATVRVSFGLYNTKADVDALVAGLEEVKRIFE